MEFVNLTQHIITISTPDGIVSFVPSGKRARVESTYSEPTLVDGVKMFTHKREIMGLPKRKDDTIYIVSSMVRHAASWRDDLASPKLILNNKKEVIGADGFFTNSAEGLA